MHGVYDQLNRLTEARAFTNIEQNPNQTAFNQWQNSGTYNGRYFNQFTYDANGNILTQQRNDEDGNTFDQMTYQYAKDANGNPIANRLYHVNDMSASTHPNAPTPDKNHFDDDIEDMLLFNPLIAQINNGSNNYKYDPIGNLIADKQEEIHQINWNVYGKIKNIIRMYSSLKKNLIFEYDANGNRIAKHQYGNMTANNNNTNFNPNNPTDWEKSTYYTRDAQGNVMAVYEYTVDDSTQQNHFNLVERNIYGSSRIGNNNQPIEMIASTPPNPNKYNHFVGYNQYELSNHLGNVLAVISDRKIARNINQDSLVDYYEPDVLLTFDYSPFGAPLHARSFTKEVCRDTTFLTTIEDLNTDFNNHTAQGWQPLSSSTSFNTSGGNLKMKKLKGAGTVGATQSFTAISGEGYDFTITISNPCNNSTTIVLELLDANNGLIYTQNVSSGVTTTFNYSFTAATGGAYTVKVYRTGNNSASCVYYIDDVLITHQETINQTLCEHFAGYRYGFQGQEKDDEVSGQGNSYGAEFWQYDSRLGSNGRWNIDPNFRQYPGWSPYVVNFDNPILFYDPNGAQAEKKDDEVKLADLPKAENVGEFLAKTVDALKPGQTITSKELKNFIKPDPKKEGEKQISSILDKIESIKAVKSKGKNVLELQVQLKQGEKDIKETFNIGETEIDLKIKPGTKIIVEKMSAEKVSLKVSGARINGVFPSGLGKITINKDKLEKITIIGIFDVEKNQTLNLPKDFKKKK